MALTTPSPSSHKLDVIVEPDLHPLYPTTAHISNLLSPHHGLTLGQKTDLISHCLTRACVFADLAVLQYLLSDPQALSFVNLLYRDEDGVGLISLLINGFGAESDRDVEREECVRLLVAHEADVAPDQAGWTPLHHAALCSPPTLISFLMTHGCSPFALTRRSLTPLDVVTAHSILPGRESVALLLEEAMRGEGWIGGRMEQRRRLLEQQNKRRNYREKINFAVEKALNIDSKWWNIESESSDSDWDDDDYDEDLYTPRLDYSTMLVFSPLDLPQIFSSLITNFQPTLRNSTPATTLYMLARFACLTCGQAWLEDLILGAADAIEDTFFNRVDDVTCLVFWLYNATLWLHLLQCDNSINEQCGMMGAFELIEELINSVFVFVIRYAERRIDQMLDASLLDYAPAGSESSGVQFESEWAFLRPFVGKLKVPASAASGSTSAHARMPSSPQRPTSPSNYSWGVSTPTSRGFTSLRQTLWCTKGSQSMTPLSSLFSDSPPSHSPRELVTFLTVLHALLILSDINPALTTQLWSQVVYWTSCEIFNRVITRKKYLCRSKAYQIGLNVGILEDWLEEAGLPSGVQTHLAPVQDLLQWLRSLSSINDFQDLVATIQALKYINPLQMRRAVRDYKYEIKEGRMSDECVQYLTQLQKDWERHRVKLGVEALRREFIDQDRDREGSTSSTGGDSHKSNRPASVVTGSSDNASHNQSIDLLFEKPNNKRIWEPMKPPQALGELLDSRYMLPILFPSDPRLLAAFPLRKAFFGEHQPAAQRHRPSPNSGQAHAYQREVLFWRSNDRKLRDIGIGTLQWVDGFRSASRWSRSIETDDIAGDAPQALCASNANEKDGVMIDTHMAPLTRKPSGRTRGRPSTPVGHT